MTAIAVNRGGTRQQVADMCTRRISEIDARQRELLTELRRLSAERTDLVVGQMAIGIETLSEDGAPPLRLESGR